MDNKSNASLIKILIVLAVVGAISLLSSYYIDWLWFKSLNFEKVFTITLLSKIALYAGVFLLAFIFIWFNLHITKKNAKPSQRDEESEDGREIIYLHPEKSTFSQFLEGKTARWIFVLVSIFGAFLVSSTVGDKWIIVQQFINRVSVAATDPIFNKSLSFYFFDLSFYQFVYSTIMTLLVITVLVVGVLYLMNATTELFLLEWKQFSFAKAHIAILLAGIFALKAWGYKLSTYGILFSASGAVYGATYTDVYARLLSYRVLIAVALLVAILILVNIFIKRVNWIVYSIGIWIVAAVILNGVYPSLMQKMIVQPNELAKERPFLENAIKYTREAYNLDKADHKQFDLAYNLDRGDIEENRLTIDNIRLWDWKPLKDNYKSQQELRPYYVFNDIDIDRYTIDGDYRQVMLSAREMEDLARIQDMQAAQTWVNQKLMYTHGYGVAMSPVNEVGAEGLPRFFVKDVPPEFSSDLTINRPEIYFGEITDNYVIVNTAQKEFDYPMGTKNVYSTYEGENGIKVNSMFRRLLLSWVLRDYKMILSSDIDNDSQVLMNRNIIQRIKKIAPYLAYDRDPYIVVNTDDGKLYWMLDAYTFTSKYPYSQPFDGAGNNYIRNAVKVICDAYTGEMTFYVADNSDPIIKTYEKIFPGLYKTLDEMPDALRDHVRYPVDMFSIQANIYRTFHMTDPAVFYNKEDKWVIPNEIVDDQETAMLPYYVITRLPGEDKEEYILMLPYTPNNRPNMNAWMCAKMDGDKYGEMLVYRFPKKETVYGPRQIEARIDQDTEISKQLSLWNQQGSRVFRGNLLVIPINNSLLYIEPLFLQAEGSAMPELKRVVATYGTTVVMEKSLDEALLKIFGEAETVPDDTDITGPQEPGETVSDDADIVELAGLARQYFDEANASLKAGDWAGYGENLDKLNEVIIKIEQESK